MPACGQRGNGALRLPLVRRKETAMSRSDTIRQLETDFWQSMVDKDAGKAMKMIADECLITGPMGTMRSDPEDYKRMTEQGDWDLDRFEFSDVDVIFPREDTAI